MRNKAVFLLFGWMFVAQNVFAVEYIFNDDGLGHYTCHDATKEYGVEDEVPLEKCKEGVKTYHFFYRDFDYQDKCYEQDVETLGYKYRNVVNLENCREPGQKYIYYFSEDVVGNNHRCFEIDAKTYGHRFRKKVELKNCIKE